MTITIHDLQMYLEANDLDSIIIGRHSRTRAYTALRTSRSHLLDPNHGCGATAEAAVQNLIDQDAGRAKPVAEQFDQPEPRNNLPYAPDFEDLLK